MCTLCTLFRLIFIDLQNVGVISAAPCTINHKTACFYAKSTVQGIETIGYSNAIMGKILQHSIQDKLQWCVSNQDLWVVQTISGQIQLSISHWNYSYITSSWSLYPVKYNIFTLRSFTFAVSENFLYLTYTTKFPLNGLDSRVIQTYSNPK